MWQGDTAKEAWGKGITTGIASVGVTGAIELGSAALVSAGVLANPIGVGVVGGIAIAVGIGFANDWLRDNFKGVKISKIMWTMRLFLDGIKYLIKLAIFLEEFFHDK